ncbi:MAG: hypothetical protein IRA32_09930, partial [Xanthomonas citri pv. citri]
WGRDGGIHAANGPASSKGTAPDSWLVVLPKNEDTALHGLPTALLKARPIDQLTGPCPPTVVGPLAAWMQPLSL